MSTPWFENDDFWTTLGAVCVSEQRMSVAQTEVDDLIQLLGLQPGAEVLDLPCGIGRHSIELARRGMAVTAVDRTRAYLERAKRAADDATLAITFEHEDMRRFRRDRPFDAIINMYTSFGYFDSIEDERGTLDNFLYNLKPGGSLVIQVTSKEIVSSHFSPRGWREINSVILIEERDVIDDWAKARNRWTVIDGDHRTTFEFAHWLYSAVELKRLLTAAGFVDVRCFGNLKKSPYDDKAEWLIAVAQRPVA